VIISFFTAPEITALVSGAFCFLLPFVPQKEAQNAPRKLSFRVRMLSADARIKG
jgi:hypothetical protein